MTESKEPDLDQARKASNKEEWPTTIELLIPIVSQKPNPEARRLIEKAGMCLVAQIEYSIGLGYFEEKRWHEAIEKFNAVPSGVPAYSDAQKKLAKAEINQELKISYRQAMMQFKQGNWIAAIESFEKVTGLQSDYQDAQIRLEEARGYDYFDRGEWAKAIKALKTVLGQDPSCKAAEDKLKEAEKQQNAKRLYEEALDQETLQKWKNAYQLYLEIVTIVSGYEDVSDRLARAEKLKQLAELCGEVYRLRTAGEWPKVRDKLDEAFKLYRQYGKLDRRYSKKLNFELKTVKAELKQQENTAYERGVEALKKRDKSQAAKEFQRVLDLNPKHLGAAAQLRELERRNRRSNEPQGTLTPPRPTGKLSDWQKIVVEVLIGIFLTNLVNTYLVALSLFQWILLISGLVAIWTALSKIWYHLRTSSSSE